MSTNFRFTPKLLLAVRVGSSAHGSGGMKIKIKRSVRHPNNSFFRNDYDFSLLELDQSLSFNERIQPIALPDVDTKIADGTMCRVSGWGKNAIKKL